jgi:hypothetical protein
VRGRFPQTSVVLLEGRGSGGAAQDHRGGFGSADQALRTRARWVRGERRCKTGQDRAEEEEEEEVYRRGRET